MTLLELAVDKIAKKAEKNFKIVELELINYMDQ